MLNLTTPISIPNIQKIRVDAVQLDSNINTANVTCSILGSGNIVYSVLQVVVRDGVSQGIRPTISPLGYSDRLESFTLSTPTGFTDLVTASVGGIVNRNKAVEGSLLTNGLLPPGTIT